MSVTIPQLKTLPFLKDDTGQLLVPCDVFIKFLHGNRHPSDTNKIVKTHNIKRFFIRKNEIRILSGHSYINFEAILLFVFNQRDNYKFCKDICEYVTNMMTERKETETSTVLDLYKEIINTKWSSNVRDIEINENMLKTLHSEHKTHFSEHEWKTVCLFEYHFQKTLIGSDWSLSYESELLAKEKFLEKVKEPSEAAKSCPSSAVNYKAKSRNRKRKVAEIPNGPTFIQNGITHTDTGVVDTLVKHEVDTDTELPKDAEISAMDVTSTSSSTSKTTVYHRPWNQEQQLCLKRSSCLSEAVCPFNIKK